MAADRLHPLDPTAVSALVGALRRSIEGEVRFDDGTRALYATDGSNYRLPPIGVVVPRHRQDILTAVRICHEHNAPLLTRGGGTSLAGQCCNAAVVLDLSKHYNRVLQVDPKSRTARVEPGVVLDRLQAEAAKHGLMFGPNPSTHSHCTIGGMLGNNACGVHSVYAAVQGDGPRSSDQIVELEVLTYDGTVLRVGATTTEAFEEAIRGGGRRAEIYAGLRDLRDQYGELIRQRFPKLPRRVSGYNLDDLLPENGGNIARALGGSEGTCILILEATVKLLPLPRVRQLLVLGYRDVYTAADDVPAIMACEPMGLEGMDGQLVRYVRQRGLHVASLEKLPPGEGWLLVEVCGETASECRNRIEQIQDCVQRGDAAPCARVFDDPHAAEAIWKVREAGLGATAFVRGMRDTWEGWEDAAVPPERLGSYLRRFRELLTRHGYKPALYGHFGQGCVHTRIEFDLVSAGGIGRFRAFVEEAADLVIEHGGSFSGEHGDGQSRAELLPKLFGHELIEAFHTFKHIWDPQGRMNPHRIVNPDPITANLRLGAGYNPARPRTFFQYPDDEYTLSRSALRCVGVGNCRRESGGTMCPSYMVTREEMHSTRGRARLLFELLQGDVITRGFDEPAMKEALDLCLACKGCKGECPVNVDVATHKAEFLAHYYRRRLRPLNAYAFGLISQWGRLGSRIPAVANFSLRGPITSSLMKRLLDIAPERRLPAFAPETFKHWYFHRQPEADPPRHGGERPHVILWPDTFNNLYHPEVARAATRFLERAGWQVIVPRQHLCCGRPLYDFGFLNIARRWLLMIIRTLRDEIRAGVPVVVLEPSCAATFRDELRNLLPRDEDARRLSQQTLLLSEFVMRHVPDANLPRHERTALVHGHCHHKSVLKFDAEAAVLRRLGLEITILDSGCCGMAGAFGFERAHYDVSVACGERVLLPAVRAAPEDTWILTNGFSCREQITQLTDRHTLHLAELLDSTAPPPKT